MSHPTTSVRAFSTSPISAAKKTYQLKRLAKAKKLLKLGAGTTDAFGMRDFLSEVQEPNESERLLRQIEQKIADLHRQLSVVVEQTPLVSLSRPSNGTPDAFDAAGLTSDPLTGSPKRKGPRERKAAQKRAQATFRSERLNELGNLLNEYKSQVAVVKEEAKKQAELKQRKEEILVKKRALLKQLDEEEETERRANLIRRTSVRHPSDGFDLDEILDDAMGKLKKTPMHPSREEREYKEREYRDVDTPKVKRVVRQVEPGIGAVSVLKRNSADEGLADPIMEKGKVDAKFDEVTEMLDAVEEVVDGESIDNNPALTIDSDAGDALSSAFPRVQTSITASEFPDKSTIEARADVPVVEHMSTPTATAAPVSNAGDVFPPVSSPVRKLQVPTTTSDANAGDPFPPADPKPKPPSDVIRPTGNNALRFPSISSPQLSSKDSLRSHIPASGFIPIDADLIVTFDAPVPKLQEQVLALRDRLRSSYPRIDNLPYDVWTSSNKRTLQTWLKILVSRWNARFEAVDSTGQVDKNLVDDRVKEVLDHMVREHDLGNDAAERMAMRWYEVFDKRNDMRGDAEGTLDWEEMEAEGLGFLSVEEEDIGLQQAQGTPPETSETKAEPVRPAGSGSTTRGVMGRRMYSTSSRRTFWGRIRSLVGADEDNQTKNEARPAARPDFKPEAKLDAKSDPTAQAKPIAKPEAKLDVPTHVKRDPKDHSRCSADKVPSKPDASYDVKPEAKNTSKTPIEDIPSKLDVEYNAKPNASNGAKSRVKDTTKTITSGPSASTTLYIPKKERPLPSHTYRQTASARSQLTKATGLSHPDEAFRSANVKSDHLLRHILGRTEADILDFALKNGKRSPKLWSGGEMHGKRDAETQARVDATKLAKESRDEREIKIREAMKSLSQAGFAQNVRRAGAGQVAPSTAETKDSFPRSKQQPSSSQSSRPEERQQSDKHASQRLAQIEEFRSPGVSKLENVSSLEGFSSTQNQPAEPSQEDRQPSSYPSRFQPQPRPQSQPSLPHLTSTGSAHMVSISAKEHTTRSAIAVGTVYFTNPIALQLIRSNKMKKGDVLGTSRIAGIMAAKKCPELIPLCHPIALTHVGVELRDFGGEDEKSRNDTTPPSSCPPAPANDLGHGGIQIEAKVECHGPTGVEMEAMTAVMAAALSVVDMCKAVDKAQRIGDVRVVAKAGGRNGEFTEKGWRSWQG
jgi:molybdenum cofactor biosynthesis enzyme